MGPSIVKRIIFTTLSHVTIFYQDKNLPLLPCEAIRATC